MPYNPSIHHRRSIRLNGYDYSSPGFYFVTCCINHRTCLSGQVVDGEMLVNDAGLMVENEWLALADRFPNIKLHEYVVMPNHFHGILEIVYRSDTPVGATLVVAPTGDRPGGSQNGDKSVRRYGWRVYFHYNERIYPWSKNI